MNKNRINRFAVLSSILVIKCQTLIYLSSVVMVILPLLQSLGNTERSMKSYSGGETHTVIVGREGLSDKVQIQCRISREVCDVAARRAGLVKRCPLCGGIL
jgi:hypothetical protein